MTPSRRIPLSFVASPDPDGQYDGEKSYEGGYHAMAVFVEDASYHGWHEHPVGKGPVRNGESGLGARYESPGPDERPGGERSQDSKAMEPRANRPCCVVWHGHRLCSLIENG